MTIMGRTATWHDIEQGLSIQNRNRGDELIGRMASMEIWRKLSQDPFFASVAIVCSPPVRGHEVIGFGASIFVPSAVADAEIASPKPGINSRIIASIYAGESVLLTRKQVAHANAHDGIDVVILQGSCWRHDILDQRQSHEVQNILPSAFTEHHAGYKLRRILCETADENAREHVTRSIVYETVGDFPEHGRTLHLMTKQSAEMVPGSLGNVLFKNSEPVLRLRDSDQDLLRAAVSGTTDQQLAVQLALTLSAVKSRWRSTLEHMERVMPGIVGEEEDGEGRGMQKRHRVLAYVRSHPEELRPFEWKKRTRREEDSQANDPHQVVAHLI